MQSILLRDVKRGIKNRWQQLSNSCLDSSSRQEYRHRYILKTLMHRYGATNCFIRCLPEPKTGYDCRFYLLNLLGLDRRRSTGPLYMKSFKNTISFIIILFLLIGCAYNNSSDDITWKIKEDPIKLWFPNHEEPVYKEICKLKMTFTAYTSSKDECWGDPWITASGDSTRWGVIAVSRDLARGKNALLPFGTMVTIEGIPGHVFTVKDVMNKRYNGRYRGDIWVPTKSHALRYGIKRDLLVTVVEPVSVKEM